MPNELFSFTIPAGHSNCSNCDQFKECRNKVWMAFDQPLPGNPEYGFPEVRGIWTLWCDDCVREKGVEYVRDEDPQPMRIVVVDDEEGKEGERP